MIRDKIKSYKIKITPGAAETARLLYPQQKIHHLISEAITVCLSNYREEVYITDIMSAYKILEGLQ